MHQLLHSVNTVVVSQHTVYRGSPVSSWSHVVVAVFDLAAGNQTVEELPNPHVLGDVTGSIAEFVLEKGIGEGFLDEVDDALCVSVLASVVQGGVLIEVADVLVNWGWERRLDETADNTGMSTDCCQMEGAAVDRGERLSLDIWVTQQLSHHIFVTFIRSKMQCCPLIEPSMVDICNQVLCLLLIQQPLNIFYVSVFRRPQQILVVALLVPPPVAPGLASVSPG